jgi:hypothetical protein
MKQETYEHREGKTDIKLNIFLSSATEIKKEDSYDRD